jgi:hypothetical protein
MPCAASPSAIAFTSSGCSLQKSATCSNDKEVLSSSQTAVAFGINGAACAMITLLMAKVSRASPALAGEAPIIGDDREKWPEYRDIGHFAQPLRLTGKQGGSMSGARI